MASECAQDGAKGFPMFRMLLQTSLCIVLCPLLVAQQVSPAAAPVASNEAPTPAQRYLTLPEGAAIELLPPGSTRFARQRAGAPVQFVLDRDVVLTGAPIIRAGVPVDGIVESVRQGSHFRHRPAEMDIRVTGIVAAQPVVLHLRCFDPDFSTAQAYADDNPHPGFNPVKWALIAVGVVLVLAIIGGDGK